MQYIEDHPDIGHLNHVILECFRTSYAPLGLIENSEPDEARRVALQSIATLEAHITFLREQFDIAKPVPTQFVAPQTVNHHQPQPQPQPQPQSKPEEKGNKITPEEQMAFDMLEQFSQ
ncbi:MAG: hypothetical protein F6K08_29380 [Okeania sp. SIO1H6]|nr:hypothetical protein [Okeania sp. SIO1H6]